ncbi:WxL domain-containing protein [Levilactobacillus tongjiangensis]|uniref:WxL domain-containing protein n=1 Tax=Levilactobacillus tongjiangensis TaxID=2486023 RepID=A0ABW1SUQ1_9LACO|nr:WxL domain-containing protein [Levilactobacillus tongjiangensis]
MKKSLSSLVLAGALLLGAVAPVTANAATTPSTGKTTTSVEFTAPDAPTSPVNPTDPTTPLDPKTPDGGDNGGATDPSKAGKLAFLYVSEGINFGSHQSVTDKAAAAGQSFKAQTVKTQDFGTGTANPNLVTEVSDARGTNAGWEVSVSASDLTGDNGSSITGASIQLVGDTNSEFVKNSAGDTITAGHPTLTTGGDGAVLYSAAAGTGAGISAMQIAPDDITLGTLPVNVKAGTYTGSLNWTLGDTPEG